MKNKISFLFLFFLLLGTFSRVNAQVLITKSDTISITEGSVILNLADYDGVIQWEKSADGSNWQEIENENSDSLIVDAGESNLFRARVIKNNCDPFYSDTTSLKSGVLTQKKATVFSNEICYIKSDFIEFTDSVLLGIIDNDTIDFAFINNALAFAMPEKNQGNYNLKISINEIDYSLEYTIQESPVINDPELYVNTVLNETNSEINAVKTELQQLSSEMEDILSPGEFDGFFLYIDSLLLSANNQLAGLTNEELEYLANLLAANPEVYSIAENANKSALASLEETDIPEKRLEKLPAILLAYSNDVSLLGDNLSTNTNHFDAQNDRYLDKNMEKLYKAATKVAGVFMNIANVYGTSMAVLRITQTVNLIRNKVYILEGDLIPNAPLPLLYNNKKNNPVSFTANYRCFVWEDYDNPGLAAVEIALDDFNDEYLDALSTLTISLLDVIAEGLGIINIGSQFPLEFRHDIAKEIILPVPMEYITSSTESVSGSISNQKVSLNSFEKKDESVELSFFTSETVEQELTWNIDYKHGNYNLVSTTLAAKANPFVPATLKIYDPENKALSGKPSEPLPEPIQVIIEDAEGNPVPGVPIHFYTECEDCGWVFHPFVTTNEYGIAETEWALGNETGFDYVKAKIVDNETIPPVEFTATAELYPPASLEPVASTNNQSGEKEKPLPKPVQVLVKDQFGNPVENIEVEFYFEEDGFGSFNPWIATSDENGIAESVWTLGDFGTQQRAKAKIVGNEEIAPVHLFAETGETEQNNYRLKKFNSYEGGQLDYQLDLTYEGEKLIRWEENDIYDGDVYNYDFSYEGNLVTIQDDEYKGTWLIEDGLTKEVKNYDKSNGGWVLTSKEKIEYSGTKIISSIYEDYYDGQWDKSKTELTYNGDALIHSISYSYENGKWEANWKYVYNYSGDKISEIIDYQYHENSWEYSSKDQYTYSGNQVTKITDYEWNNGAWEQYAATTINYDANGNVSEFIGGNWKEEFVYENGKGNLSNFLTFMDYDYYGYNPYKSGNIKQESKHRNPIGVLKKQSNKYPFVLK